uniref:Uncharacterized protein n=1 Tax=Cafeteria roenbergensis TaxID=33653 RepID=A0A7S0K6W4_CAFRO
MADKVPKGAPAVGASAPREATATSEAPASRPAPPSQVMEALRRKFGGVPAVVYLAAFVIIASIVWGWRGSVGASVLGGLFVVGLVADGQADAPASSQRRARREDRPFGARIRTLHDLPRPPPST